MAHVGSAFSPTESGPNFTPMNAIFNVGLIDRKKIRLTTDLGLFFTFRLIKWEGLWYERLGLWQPNQTLLHCKLALSIDPAKTTHLDPTKDVNGLGHLHIFADLRIGRLLRPMVSTYRV